MTSVDNVWRRHSDGQLTEAAGVLHEYTADGQKAIRAELERRGLPQPPPQNVEPLTEDQAPYFQEYPLASPWRRLVALLIDLGLIVPALAAADLDFYIAPAVAYMFCVSVIEIALLVTQGATIGKMLLGLRIVDAASGDHPGTVRILIVRGLLPNLAYGIPLVGPVFLLADAACIFTKQRQTLHDQIARTLVVSTRARA